MKTKYTPLTRPINVNGWGVTNYKSLIDSNSFYVSSEVKTVPKYKYSRTAYNRMNSAQQEVYDKKLEETKTEYRLYMLGGFYHSVPKQVFDYFNNK